MILCRRLGFAIVLIPRSGSTAIAAACRSVLRWGEVLRNKHLTAGSMAGHLQGLHVVAVHRNPWARIYSEWCLYQREIAYFDKLPSEWGAEVRKWAGTSFVEFATIKYTRDQGNQCPSCLWMQYCHTPSGLELVTEPWPFEQLPLLWSRFAVCKGLPALKRANAASRGDYRDAFTTALRDEIAAWAAWEIETFGYDFDRGESVLHAEPESPGQLHPHS